MRPCLTGSTARGCSAAAAAAACPAAPGSPAQTPPRRARGRCLRSRPRCRSACTRPPAAPAGKKMCIRGCRHLILDEATSQPHNAACRARMHGCTTVDEQSKVALQVRLAALTLIDGQPSRQAKRLTLHVLLSGEPRPDTAEARTCSSACALKAASGEGSELRTSALAGVPVRCACGAAPAAAPATGLLRACAWPGRAAGSRVRAPPARM